ncbi:MAG: hypothetical protein OXH98_16710 [Caldilineaceae bacterium]|nr:hypothetical protein [Caldilineaceae bacterium]
MRTHTCRPTLNDSQVLEFCKQGFLLLEGVVPDEINRRVVSFLDDNPSHEPTEILVEDWFVDNVILNPQAAGAVRSLLSQSFGLPIVMSNHRVECPSPAQGWHRDGNSQHGPALNYLQVFYYPEDCPLDMGPTELLPGSHFLFSLSKQMGHYGAIRGAFRSAAPAGSIFVTVYSIWHRRGAASGHGMRNLLKYNYWRTEPPKRDWVRETDFDIATANYKLEGQTFREQFRDCNDAAEMFFWLLGRSDAFRLEGGQGWPLNRHVGKYLDSPYGVPVGL